MDNFAPRNRVSNSWTTDKAWVEGKKFLKENSEKILQRINKIKGFETATFTGVGGEPEVCDILYLRETVHTSINAADISINSEKNYHVMIDDACEILSPPKHGIKNEQHKIGIAAYNLDIHPYEIMVL